MIDAFVRSPDVLASTHRAVAPILTNTKTMCNIITLHVIFLLISSITFSHDVSLTESMS